MSKIQNYVSNSASKSVLYKLIIYKYKIYQKTEYKYMVIKVFLVVKNIFGKHKI